MRSIPNLSIVRRPLELTLSVIQRFSDGSQKRFLWALTFHQRLVLIFEWETGMARTRTLSEDITAIWHWTSIDGEYAPLH